MSLNETYSQTQTQFVSCPKCGFMNYAGLASCERCQEGLLDATDPSSPRSRRRAWRRSKLNPLNMADTFFMVTLLFGMYYFYFDHNGARTESQKQFRLALLLIGSFGVLITGALKFIKKRAR